MSKRKVKRVEIVCEKCNEKYTIDINSGINHRWLDKYLCFDCVRKAVAAMFGSTARKTVGRKNRSK